MNEKDYRAEGQLALMSQQYEKSLELFKMAIKADSKDPAGYKGAGCASVSLGLYDQGIEYFKQAIKMDPNNGNRYFDLGYAYAMCQKSGEAVKAFVRATEIGCTNDVYADLYNLLGIICFDIRRFDDALINFQKSEEYSGINVELLQRKAVIYGMKNDLKNGILAANQLKMVSPSDYKGYQLAFRLLLQAKMFGRAKQELEKAAKYSTKTSDYYFDLMTLELEEFKADGKAEHLTAALNVVAAALEEKDITVQNIVDCYINAAEIYLESNNADKTIECLNAAVSPADSYNSGFMVIAPVYEEKELSQEEVEEMRRRDMEEAAEKRSYSDGSEAFLRDDEIFHSEYESSTSGMDFLTDVPDEEITAEEPEKAKVNGEGYELTDENKDQINRLYIGAYTLKDDNEQIINYSRKLQQSKNKHYVYMGKYGEAKAALAMQKPDAEEQYRELNKYFRNIMIKDPTDLDAVSYRIQAYIDIKQYDEAISLCSLLSKEAREPVLERINRERGTGK